MEPLNINITPRFPGVDCDSCGEPTAATMVHLCSFCCALEELVEGDLGRFPHIIAALSLLPGWGKEPQYGLLPESDYR